MNENFEPIYVIPKDKAKIIALLKKKAKGVKTIVLATDEDREGEAIAWHLVEAIGVKDKKVERIVFHEITKQAVLKALSEPRELDINRVDAQQGRRILDRLVGYSISPFLWKKVRKGLSAGRVQSVALRLVCEREDEIGKFVQKEYWHITADLAKKDGKSTFQAKLAKKDGEKIEIDNEKDAQAILKSIENEQFIVKKIKKKQVKRNPYPPFTTSTLQQDAARKLGFSAKKTMFLAQQLYEGIDLGEVGSTGLITYMRTDSYHLADTAVKEVRSFITDGLGEKYLPSAAQVYKTKKKGAQEAHEAIRPTSVERTPKSLSRYLNKAQLDLYELIWKRTIACQMTQAIMDTVSATIDVAAYSFSAAGSVVIFDGFLKIYEGKDERQEEPEKKEKKDVRLPPLEEKEELKTEKITPTQHFTKPPARYSEATLVKALEEHGIGRPSTYAPIMSNIADRG